MSSNRVRSPTPLLMISAFVGALRFLRQQRKLNVAGSWRARRAEPVGARQVIPKVIETSDRQADNKPEWELHRETLVKQDEDALVLA